MQARSLRCIAALVAVLLGGLLLPAAAPQGADIATDVANWLDTDHLGHGEHQADVVGPAVVIGRSWGWSWSRAVARAAGTALVLVLGAAALLASRPPRPVVAWCLARPDRSRPTARRISPLAARRAPPAPACC
jgi:hypothetical protein